MPRFVSQKKASLRKKPTAHGKGVIGAHRVHQNGGVNLEDSEMGAYVAKIYLLIGDRLPVLRHL